MNVSLLTVLFCSRMTPICAEECLHSESIVILRTDTFTMVHSLTGDPAWASVAQFRNKRGLKTSKTHYIHSKLDRRLRGHENKRINKV